MEQQELLVERPLSVYSLTTFLSRKLNAILGASSEFRPILIHGTLTQSDRYFYIEDSDVQQSRVYLDAYKLNGKLAEHVGRTVTLRVLPYIREFKGRINVGCEVLELVGTGEIKREIAEINPHLLKTPRRHLPEKDQYLISVICPGASDRAWCDFLGGIDKKINGKLHPDSISLTLEDISIHIRRIPTNMLSSADITASIRSSDGDIVVLTRGGGDEEEFGVFSDREVIRAWAEHPGYRISAIGHSDNITHVDIISDTHCRVPFDAGVEVVNLLGDIARQRRLREQERLMGKLTAEKEALTKEKETLTKQIAELNVRLKRLTYLSLGAGLTALGLVTALVVILFK